MIFHLFLSLILGEHTTGLMIFNNEQILNINLDKKFKSIVRSNLLEKEEGSDDYILVKKMNKYTRYIKDEDEYAEYKQEMKRRRRMEKDGDYDYDNEKYEKEVNFFNEIFVDLSRVPRDSTKLYYVNLELLGKNDKQFTVDSRAFMYSSKHDRWVISDKINSNSYSDYWKYGAMAAAGLLLIGLFVHFFA
ncbi:hypothetical protein P3W45_000843 [Vairimorpha bombi]|jgi:hypothetical protein